MKDLLVLFLAVAILSFIVVFFNIGTTTQIPDNQPKKFSSYDELKTFLETNQGYTGYYYGTFAGRAVTEVEMGAEAPKAETGAEDYSTTNIQVSGVDEADIVKNDGKYIYVVSGESVAIVDAFPAEDAKILSKIEFNGTPTQIFINRDKLVVFGTETAYEGKKCVGFRCGGYYSTNVFIRVYNVADRSNPVLVRNISTNGYYYDSRMIGDYVYVITNQPVYYYKTEPIPLPVVYSEGKAKVIQAQDIYYFDIPDTSYTYTNILSINTQNDDEELYSKTFLMGYNQNTYVSTNNIYVTYKKRLSDSDFADKIIDEVIIPNVPSNIQNDIKNVRASNAIIYQQMQEIEKILEDYLKTLNPEESAKLMKSMEEKMVDVYKEIAKEMEKTVIHKISINNGVIEYKTNGEVPGYTLNQFSMDEFNGNFRIATTTGNWREKQMNHVYVLDDSLKIIGKLEDLAEGERIYSVRFIGEKGYMVTFRQIDPLFVIDLSDPSNPKVLGFLKIPGVSDYLHPYDETHVIGVGRDATEEEGRMLGMKLSLFDVSDVANPKEVSKYIIGERGTTSDALYDHKAFLFSKSKNLLVIPVQVSEGRKWNVFQGAYVFNVDLDKGFVLKGRITHRNETVNETDYYYDYNAYIKIKRSLYIDDVLYTISSKMIKMNNLDNLDEINKVELPFKETVYPVYRGIEITGS
ncbi:MAG: beta-propeller domain-containing protein [Candidatus Aenigmatarchaeota archaeon]